MGRTTLYVAGEIPGMRIPENVELVQIGTVKEIDWPGLFPEKEVVEFEPLPRTTTIHGRINVDYVSPDIWFFLRGIMCPGMDFSNLRYTWFYRYKLKKRCRRNYSKGLGKGSQ